MKKTITLILLVATITGWAQQDPQYNQYQFNQMVINPAYAGSRDALSAVVDGRYQWGKLDNGGSPQTIAFSLHGPLKKKRIGLGLSGYSDKIGPKSTVAVYGSFAYILPITNKLKLSFGLRAGLFNYYLSELQFKDTESQSDFTNKSNKSFDMDAGIYLKSNSFYCGLSSTHLNHSNIYKYTSASNATVSYDLKQHFFFIISKGFKAGENVVLNPTIMIKNTSGITSTDLNINFLLNKRIWLGGFIRNGLMKGSTAIGVLAQVYVTNKLRIGYSFDRSLNKTQHRLGNGHEIMIGFDFNTFKATMLSPRYL